MRALRDIRARRRKAQRCYLREHDKDNIIVMSTADIRDAAMKLTPEEKARLAEELLASLDVPDQAEIDAAHAEEAERRIDALDSGKTQSVPADEVFRDLEARKR